MRTGPMVRAALAAAGLALLPAAPLHAQPTVLFEDELDIPEDRVAVEILPGDAELGVGDVFKVVVVVEGQSPGAQIMVRARLGGRTVELPAKRMEPGGQGEPDLTGPWVYETAPIEIHAGSEPNDADGVTVEFRDATRSVRISGMTGSATIELLEGYIARAKAAAHPLEALVLLEKVSALLEALNSPPLYQYAASLLRSGGGPRDGLLQAAAEGFTAAARAGLNRQLERHLDALAADSTDGDAPANLDGVRKRRALLLLKETALARGVERLIELNRWKRGSGVIPPGSFLGYDAGEAMRRLRRMDDADDAQRFLQTGGLAGAEPQIAAMRAQLAQHARRHAQELRALWSRMQAAREWYNWASNQTNLVFDWEPSRRKYAAQYRDAESGYEQVLREHDLLKAMVKDPSGAEVPLWSAILAARSDAELQAAIDGAVDGTESALREMLGNVVEMRSLENMAALGSGRYAEVHRLAAAGEAPGAAGLVGLAKGVYQEGADESYWQSAAVDFGLGVVQIAGTLFPPAFYAATTVLVARRGEETVAAYASRAEADAAERAGVGSTLEADNARRHLRRSIGALAMEGAFGYLDFSVMRALRPARGAEVPIARLKEIGEEVRQQWAAQRRFALDIAELETSILRAQELAAKKRAAIADWDRKIRKALADGNEALREQRMTKRANDQRILVGWNELARRKAADLRELKRTGPTVAGAQNRLAIQGQDVERAAARFYEDLSADPAKGVDKIGERRYQLGERIEGAAGALQRRRFEVRLNETIVDASGRPIRPPQRVHLPGEAAPVANPWVERESMRYDRIIVDHKDKVVYLEDLIRTGNRDHLIKTHSYTHGLEQMFPGYRVAGVARKHAGAWPRDVVWGTMNTPIRAVSADLRPYTVHKGTSLPGGPGR